MLLLFAYLASTLRTMSDVQMIVVALLVGLLLESVLIALAYTTGQSFNFAGFSTHNSTFDAEGFRPAGTLGSPNTAGAYLSLMVPVAFAALCSPFGRMTRLLAGAAMAAGLYALVVTQSRGAWIAFLVAVTVCFAGMLVLGWLPARIVAVLALIAIGVTVVAAPVVTNRLTRDDRGAAESRVPLMRLAGDMIRDNPVLGVGANNFSVRIADYAGPEFSGDFLYAVHNKYLLVWAESGIAALLAYLWFIGSALLRGLRVVLARDRRVSPLALGLTAALLGHVVHMTVDVFRGRPGIQSLVLCAGLLVAIARVATAPGDQVPSAETTEPPAALPWAVLVGGKA